jgi:hypothetical protein
MNRKQASWVVIFLLCAAMGRLAWHQQALRARNRHVSASQYYPLPGGEAVLSVLDETVTDGVGNVYSHGRVAIIPSRKPYPPLHTMRRDNRTTFIDFEYLQPQDPAHRTMWTASEIIIVYPKAATISHKQESISFEGKTYSIKYSTEPLPR